MNQKVKRIFDIKFCFIYWIVLTAGCDSPTVTEFIQDVTDLAPAQNDAIWLSHEHILVDFIGADSINPEEWNDEDVRQIMLPYLNDLKKFDVRYFVDATPNYLGRDVKLLEKISKASGIKIITNTGLYGARNHLYIPEYAFDKTAEELASMWIDEFENGIDNSEIKPGFIKISVNMADPLHEMDEKLVRAACLTHSKTGLTIGSHTGEAKGLWPQLEILEDMKVDPSAFIWIHAQNESDPQNYLKAAELGCWISLDGLGWELEGHLQKIIFARDNQILNRILISHDAGWFDPQKETQQVTPYTNIFEKLIPKLDSVGFGPDDIQMLLSTNPRKAFTIGIRSANP